MLLTTVLPTPLMFSINRLLSKNYENHLWNKITSENKDTVINQVSSISHKDEDGDGAGERIEGHRAAPVKEGW